MMNLSLLHERLMLLKQERDELIGQVNAYNGAVQECEYWIAQMEESGSAALELVEDEE